MACEFLATVLRILSRTFSRHSRECRACRENFLVSGTSCEVFQHVEKFYANFFSKIFRKSVARLSCDCCASVANLSPRNFGELTMQNFCDTRTNVARVSHDSLAKTSRLSGEKIKLSDIRMNVARHSHQCRATVVQI